MACIGLGITLPTFSIPGLEIGFALPNIAIDAELCCKINIGPFPDLSAVVPISLPTSVMIALNATMAVYQAYIDSLLSNAFIDCPLD